MEAHKHNIAAPCRCGGQARVFGPGAHSPASHWGIYCSKNECEKMSVADSLEEAIELWNEEQALELMGL
ncbi:MAG: hypothetical protein C0622_04360 [Desulfuromonas sp.]|nr:MAG: hypothetical protein C0622_04360 [Desulfuromonas sp.]